MNLNSVKKIFIPFLGFHEVESSIKKDDIKALAINFEPKNKTMWWLSTPAKLGIYKYNKNQKEYYLSRTVLGSIFPSLHRLSLTPKAKLIPHPIRLVFGIFLILWVIFGVIPLIYYLLNNFTFGLLAFCFWAASILIIWTLTQIEKKIAIRGFVKAIKDEK
jgi:hypothetical protein